ncbi:MAG TPA: RdgB/HAM1 family non-canonical purine NTP pyrophosphatase [Jatrophihabitans sp.]|jgi:XTP/dITP diphosphohydrolase|nr:RdgB/HAM1 family non-canonical purine NTP pyrophosphatase [Jatrophihabitans sp.]
MTARLLLATRNTKKLDELRRILTPLMPVEVLGLADVPAFDEVPESGASFAENALIKAVEAVKQTGLVTVADDSGLAVDALNGMPGVLSARWAGARSDDAANLSLLLEQLADTPEDRLGATFVCAAALVTPDGSQVVREGRMPGRLIRQPRGEHGFGYDPIFVPEGYEQTSAELPPSDKDAISHRGRALRELLPFILRALGGPGSE